MWTNYIRTPTYLINRLLSSVINGKYLYEMIYKKIPTLSHLRVFGCLCFSTILNNHDKLGSRSGKCVMMGYSNYKKDSTSKEVDTSNVFQDLNHINYFDIEYPVMPYDDERVDLKLNIDQKSQSDSSQSSESDRNMNTVDFTNDKSVNDILLLLNMSR
ncbi:hypothetical protein Tco_0022640 [Tanacetum coccineum]